MSETFAELLEESLNSSEMKPGAVIEAEVVDINGDYVIVNAGLKSESEIPASCLLYTSPSPRDRTRSRMPSSA